MSKMTIGRMPNSVSPPTNTDKLKEGYVPVTMPIDFGGKYFINTCGKVRNLKRELKFQRLKREVKNF